MILNDSQIMEYAIEGMITPFQVQLIREVSVCGHEQMSNQIRKAIRYGLSSYGYDIRLSSKEFKIFRHIPGTIVNPKNFNSQNLESVELQQDKWGDFFIIPAHSYGLGVAIEKLQMPPNLTAICIGKSTYARAGLIANLTPVEASWIGHLTIEISNSSSADCRVYANEGIAQLLFFQGEECAVNYESRQGKYQNQPEEIVLPLV
ncbi:MAG: dCTP deaminase [Minisyncoccia bacterium]